MAAPQIPNLLFLRGRGNGRRGGRGGMVEHEDTKASAKQQDLIVQATDDDASISRLSMTLLGYLNDPFAHQFAPKSLLPGSCPRLPIINRGTYMRTVAIDHLVKGFLSSSDEPKQIISLGAGSDTRFFRFKETGLLNGCIYHELDFKENTCKKASNIYASARTKLLLKKQDSDIYSGEDEIHANDYHLHAVDLRHLDPGHAEHASRPELSAINPDLPTVIISECCLVYLQPDVADAVVKYITTQLLKDTTPCGMVLYEPTNPFDAFGKVMVANLASRGIVLQTLKKYGSEDAQLRRLQLYGFGSGQNWIDLASVSEHWIDEAEKERLSKLEFLDEVEELNLLMEHYCIVRGWRDGSGKDNGDVWKNWKTSQIIESTGMAKDIV